MNVGRQPEENRVNICLQMSPNDYKWRSYELIIFMMSCGNRCGSMAHLQRLLDQGLLFILQLVKFVINSAPRKQFLMTAHFAYLAFVKHDNLVDALNGR